jgi:dTDP-4-dehydrorhamnose reductase
MKVLILGSAGMLGHKLYQVLSRTYEVSGTIKSDFDSISRFGFFRKPDIYTKVNAEQITSVEKAITTNKPDVIINCIGVIKPLSNSRDRLSSIWVNALFPHQVYQICSKSDIRLIHISTDCVFSGKKGNYKETDASDAEDIYGKTKFLGELSGTKRLTIRTSLIGQELATSNNLIEWFLSNRGKTIKGYSNAVFNGFTTICFAGIISKIIAERDLDGIYNIGSEPISKYKLLTLIRDKMKLKIEIEEYPDFACNRSLDSSSFRTKTGFTSKSWEEMIDEFVDDAQQYAQWRA